MGEWVRCQQQSYSACVRNSRLIAPTNVSALFLVLLVVVLVLSCGVVTILFVYVSLNHKYTFLLQSVEDRIAWVTRFSSICKITTEEQILA